MRPVNGGPGGAFMFTRDLRLETSTATKNFHFICLIFGRNMFLKIHIFFKKIILTVKQELEIGSTVLDYKRLLKCFKMSCDNINYLQIILI